MVVKGRGVLTKSRKRARPFLFGSVPDLRRGVRSGVQLSCTETRFQKCSQSAKNSSKHPMLSISMAYNMNSKNQKKHSRNQNSWFYYVNSAPNLRNHKKYPKKTLHSIAICSKYFISMVYFRCYLMNPHVQGVHKMCGKWG